MVFKSHLGQTVQGIVLVEPFPIVGNQRIQAVAGDTEAGLSVSRREAISLGL